MNSVLQMAIDRAKADNVPNDNIDRAIKKGTGELKDGAVIEEVVYEAYGPGGVAIMISCLTDNMNRTLTNIRTILTKHNGKMGVAGSVSYLFQRKGVLELPILSGQLDAAELAAIDAGADDFLYSNGVLAVFFPVELLSSAQKVLHRWNVQNSRIELLPLERISLVDPKIARETFDLLELLEDDEDIQQVMSNVHFSDEVLKSFR